MIMQPTCSLSERGSESAFKYDQADQGSSADGCHHSCLTQFRYAQAYKADTVSPSSHFAALGHSRQHLQPYVSYQSSRLKLTVALGIASHALKFRTQPGLLNFTRASSTTQGYWSQLHKVATPQLFTACPYEAVNVFESITNP